MGKTRRNHPNLDFYEKKYIEEHERYTKSPEKALMDTFAAINVKYTAKLIQEQRIEKQALANAEMTAFLASKDQPREVIFELQLTANDLGFLKDLAICDPATYPTPETVLEHFQR